MAALLEAPAVAVAVAIALFEAKATLLSPPRKLLPELVAIGSFGFGADDVAGTTGADNIAGTTDAAFTLGTFEGSLLCKGLAITDAEGIIASSFLTTIGCNVFVVSSPVFLSFLSMFRE